MKILAVGSGRTITEELIFKCECSEVINIVTPTFIPKEKVCERYPECMNCPLKYGSRNCEELEQNEINDIMYIVEVVERRSQTPFHKFGMSKEIMARLRAKLIWNKKTEK